MFSVVPPDELNESFIYREIMSARKPAEERLDELVAAAMTAFARNGFRATRIEEVARLAGVSPGSVYNYVAGKEALFRMAMELAIDGEVRPPTKRSSKRTSTPRETVRWVAGRLDFVSDFPAMERALTRNAPADVPAEVAEVFGELFDVLVRTRHAAAILERSAADMPDLRDFFVKLRREFFARVIRYVSRREAEGVFLPLADAEATTRVLVEATTWSTRGRLSDRDPTTAVSDDSARTALVEMAVRTLVGPPARARTTEGRNARRSRKRS